MSIELYIHQGKSFIKRMTTTFKYFYSAGTKILIQNKMRKLNESLYLHPLFLLSVQK